MISTLELRHIIESAFLPKKCVCSIQPDHTMTIRIGSVEEIDAFTATGIDFSRFSTSRAIAGLVGELKEEMKMGQVSIQQRLQA
jgi:hypothetical protein